ncbi:hypothetical protein COY62_01385 [bacterium (Candidatus Howlettbacteria) CG_4_10_14_0_8_um_filter_40_9]|nr:MAG: hypothetical protein COY62_01385 [bacterium (Candidatus Howlettbacteria) CG_4_10_14_0_8_um_filter_40_9]
MNIDFKKGIINGVIVYVAVFMVISVLIALKVDATGLLGQVSGVATVAIAAYLLAQKVDLKDTAAALGYGVVTAVVVLALDFLITKRFNPDFNPFAVNMLVGYAVIVLVPTVAKQMKK